MPRGDYLHPDTHQILISLNWCNALKLHFLFFKMVISALDIDYETNVDRHVYKTKFNILELFFQKLKDHSLVTSNM
jgi:hypothetical protein